MSNGLLTDSIIARTAARMFGNLPWQIRGSTPFKGRAEFSFPGYDLTLMLDEFAETHIAPAILQAATTRVNELTAESCEAYASVHFRGTTLRMLRQAGDSIRYIMQINYTPPVPDFGMPVYFWLGEESDVV